ncbi:MAG: DUF58 domain-containing protein [Mycobacteriales bacterium]
MSGAGGAGGAEHGHGAVRLTASGVRVLVAAVVLVGVGYALAWPALVVLGVGAGLALVAAVVLLATGPRVELSREVFPDRVTRGEVAVGMVTARHAAGRGAAWLSAADRFTLRGRSRPVPVTLPRLGRGGRSETGYPLPTDRRGVATIGPLLADQTDPLGLVRRRQRVGGELTLRVHPRTHPVQLRSASRSRDREEGGAETVLAGSVTFHRLREYAPGDDLRRIHWRSSARANTLMVRQNVDVTRPEVTVALVTELAAYPDETLFEEAVEAAAAVLMAAGRARVPARLVTGDGPLAGGRGGGADPRAAMDELAGVEPTAGGGLPALADRMAAVPRNGFLVVACGSLSPADRAAARRLAAGYRPAVLASFTASPAATTATGGLTLLETATAADFCRQWTHRRGTP